MPRGALIAILAAALYLILRGMGIIHDTDFAVWVKAALLGVFLLAAAINIKNGNALWAAIFAALAVGWNPWVRPSGWAEPLPWDKWAMAVSVVCGLVAGAFVVRYWGRGETA
jgi:hypothetical protein